jgi:hypothetical protein
MLDMIVMTAILLLARGGGLWLYIAARAVRPSRQEVREIQMLESLQRIEKRMTHVACHGTFPLRPPPAHWRLITVRFWKTAGSAAAAIACRCLCPN